MRFLNIIIKCIKISIFTFDLNTENWAFHPHASLATYAKSVNCIINNIHQIFVMFSLQHYAAMGASRCSCAI